MPILLLPNFYSTNDPAQWMPDSLQSTRATLCLPWKYSKSEYFLSTFARARFPSNFFVPPGFSWPSRLHTAVFIFQYSARGERERKARPWKLRVFLNKNIWSKTVYEMLCWSYQLFLLQSGKQLPYPMADWP